MCYDISLKYVSHKNAGSLLLPSYRYMIRLTRFLIALSILTLGILSSDGPVHAGRGPVLKPVEKKWDFGRIKKGQVREKTFEIRNAGDEELVIKKINTCCDYTLGALSAWKIPPGKKAELTLISDTTRKRAGVDTKSVTIASNDPANPVLKIRVYSEIVAGAPVEDPEKPGSAASGRELAELFTSMSPADLYAAKGADGKTVILDVSEECEFRYKHIPHAFNFPRSKFHIHNRTLLYVLGSTGKDAVIGVHCGGGFRSSYVARKLREKGYNAYNLEGGIKAWEKEGLPIIEGEKVPGSKEPLTVNLEEAYEHYYRSFKENVVWIDVRDDKDYSKGHIKGSINLPVDTIEPKLGAFPRDKEIIFYCDGPNCGRSRIAARMLIAGGFKHPKVKVFEDGYYGWEEAGYPVEKGSI